MSLRVRKSLAGIRVCLRVSSASTVAAAFWALCRNTDGLTVWEHHSSVG